VTAVEEIVAPLGEMEQEPIRHLTRAMRILGEESGTNGDSWLAPGGVRMDAVVSFPGIVLAALPLTLVVVVIIGHTKG